MACDFFGLPLEALKATSLDGLLQIPDTEVRALFVSRTPGEAWPLVYRAGDGSIRNIEILIGSAGGAACAADSRQVGVLLSCAFFDMTEKMAAEARLRALAADMGHIDEHDRCRLATYLHDEVSQGLGSLHNRLEILAKAAPGSIPEAEYGQMFAILAQCRERTHSAVFSLSLPVLKNFGLSVALEQEGEDFCARHGLGFSFHGQDPSRELPQDLAALLLRCVQELLQNVADHAKARQVRVRLFYIGAELRIEIRDDGRGFPTPQRQDWKQSQGFGLFSTGTRLATFGGRMEIVSTAGNTIITLAVPLP
jgi:signal transduction histidine kinase